MPRSRARKVVEFLEFVVSIDDLHGDGAAKSLAFPNAGQQLDSIFFDPHSSAATVAALAPTQLLINRIGLNRHPRWESIDEGNHRLPVRFASGPVSQHQSSQSLT